MPTNNAKNKQNNQLLVNFMGILTNLKINNYIEKGGNTFKWLKHLYPFRLTYLNIACKYDHF